MAMRRNQKRRVGGLQLVPQAAHLAHVQLAAHGVHHAAGGEEEQGLEERMRHQMEDSRREDARAAAQEHVSELADGGVGEHALQIVLRQGDGCRQRTPSGSRRLPTTASAAGAWAKMMLDLATR